MTDRPLVLADRLLAPNPRSTGRIDLRVERVKRQASLRLNRKFTLHDAAAIACLEKHYFSSLFKQVTGMTLTGWRRELRVSEAEVLLSYTSKSIGTIAREVGYADWNGLERAFRAVRGITPSSIRARGEYKGNAKASQHNISRSRGNLYVPE